MRAISKSRLIFDFDDAIFIDNRNSTSALKTANMVKYANETIVSTDWLNDFCRKQGKTATVIPTPVETDIVKPKDRKENKIPVIGWIGSAWTTGYMEMVIPVLQKLAAEYEFTFLTVGAKTEFSVKGVNHSNIPWEPGIETKALAQIDIGIMPLPDDDYARAKGGFKLYLYMAAGLPCIASPVGINSAIIKEGVNGLLAATENQWHSALKTLLDKPELRHSMGESGRKQAVAEYDRKVCFARLISIINKQ
jgi:glycosyltransferase involved in cell wall biosynthesis